MTRIITRVGARGAVAVAALALSTVGLPARQVNAQPALVIKLKDESGVLRMKAVYPLPGSTISVGTPMITADASSLESPLDPRTVTVTLNGADVTADSEIMPTYIVYTPPSQLPPGRYEVRITAKNVAHTDIEPLVWTFTAGGEAPPISKGKEKKETQQPPATTAEVKQRSKSLSGSYSMSLDKVSADFVRRAVPDVSVLFREKEGDKVNADLDFTSVTDGRTIMGAYHRETQDYTGIVQDKGRISYRDDNFAMNLGHFWFALSDLTLMGAELGGVTYDRQNKEWGLTLFSGRTQDPSTSGTYKQNTSGMRTSYDWNRFNRTYMTALSANELDDPVRSLTSAPSKDSIIGVYHQFRNEQGLSGEIEFSKNTRQKGAAAELSDDAWRVALTRTESKYSTTLEMYDIGENFLPVSEGSSRYLRNDRRGYKLRGRYKYSGRLTAGGESENFETQSTGIETRRNSMFATLTAGGNLKSVTLSRGRLTSNGSSSRTDGISATFGFKPSHVFAETRASAGWQRISFSSASALTRTIVKTFSATSSYKNILAITAAGSLADTSDLLTFSAVENKNMSLGLEWNAIPFKLTVSHKYELSSSEGSTVDNTEKRNRTNFKYMLKQDYSLNLGLDRVVYRDAVSPYYDYKQQILRTGMERSF